MRTNIGNLLTRRAFISPSVEALVEGTTGRRLTFPELNARANRVANALRADHVQKGDRVALLLMNGAEFAESFFAVAKIGAVAVTLNWRLVADELEFILADSGTTVLVFGGEFAATVAELQGRGGQTQVREWIQVGGEPAPFAKDYGAWSAAGPDTEPMLDSGDDDLLYIMYTSGTTGLPKGVMHTHDTTMWALSTLRATSDMHYKDRYLIALPLYHVGALTPMLGCVYGGCTIVLMRAFDPKAAWRIITEERVNTTLLVPAMLQFMLAAYDATVHDVSSMRWATSGAAPVPVSIIEEYARLGVEIHQVYGLTETNGPACLILGEDALTRAGSTGRAFFHTDVRVVDDDGNDCAPGVPGEVIVRGRHNMIGYWNRPEATAQTIRDGWLHTGDVATITEDGFVTIMDRIKDMLISGGENVYPAEIENVLLSHPGVADAAVIGVPSPKWGESPMALVVRSDDTLTEEALMEFVNAKVAGYKRVKVVTFATEIPRNPTGKILKRVIRERYTVDAPE